MIRAFYTIKMKDIIVEFHAVNQILNRLKISKLCERELKVQLRRILTSIYRVA